MVALLKQALSVAVPRRYCRLEVSVQSEVGIKGDTSRDSSLRNNNSHLRNWPGIQANVLRTDQALSAPRSELF